MAYVEEQDPKKLLVPGAAQQTTNQGSTLAGSGGMAPTGAASPTAASTPGSGFTNLETYLGANKGQGAKVAGEINAAGSQEIKGATDTASGLASGYENKTATDANTGAAKGIADAQSGFSGTTAYSGPAEAPKDNALEDAYNNVNKGVDAFSADPYKGQSALQKNHGYGQGFAALDNFIGRQDGRETISQWEKNSKAGNAQSSYDKGNAAIGKAKGDLQTEQDKWKANQKAHHEGNGPTAPPPVPGPGNTGLPPPTDPVWTETEQGASDEKPGLGENLKDNVGQGTVIGDAAKIGMDTVTAVTKGIDDIGNELERARKGFSLDNAGKIWDTAVNDVEAFGQQLGKDFSIENINTQVGDALGNTYDAADKFINQDLSINNIEDTVSKGFDDLVGVATGVGDTLADTFGSSATAKDGVLATDGGDNSNVAVNTTEPASTTPAPKEGDSSGIQAGLPVNGNIGIDLGLGASEPAPTPAAVGIGGEDGIDTGETSEQRAQRIAEYQAEKAAKLEAEKQATWERENAALQERNRAWVEAHPESYISGMTDQWNNWLVRMGYPSMTPQEIEAFRVSYGYTAKPM